MKRENKVAEEIGCFIFILVNTYKNGFDVFLSDKVKVSTR